MREYRKRRSRPRTRCACDRTTPSTPTRVLLPTLKPVEPLSPPVAKLAGGMAILIVRLCTDISARSYDLDFNLA
jgi:hypothetical protein